MNEEERILAMSDAEARIVLGLDREDQDQYVDGMEERRG